MKLNETTTGQVERLTREIFHLQNVLKSKNKKIRNQHATLSTKNTELRGLKTALMEALVQIESMKQQLKDARGGSPDLEKIIEEAYPESVAELAKFRAQ